MAIQQQPRSSAPGHGLAVGEAMRRGIVTCPRDATVPRIAAAMTKHGVHAVIVPPLEGGPPLIVTDLDLVRAAVRRSDYAQASDLAREPIATLRADAPFEEAIELMAVRYVTHLLATEAATGTPIGVISSLDVAAVVGGRDPALAHQPRPSGPRPATAARRLSHATVGEVMHPGIVACTPDASLVTVARAMADHRVHCVAVAGIDATAGRAPHLTWGLIGDIELVVAVHGGLLSAPAARIASTAPLAVRESESLDRTATLMAERDSSHVVAVGRDGLPSGMVSTLDVAEILSAD
jgi:CBS domain-containing protein